VKTITATEFFAKPSARQKWKAGQVVLVTTDGKPDLEIRKLGSRRNSARGCVKEIPLSGGVGVPLGEEGWQATKYPEPQPRYRPASYADAK
jgi:hypothetical protein